MDLRFDRGEMFGRITICRDRQDLERPWDGVIEGREALEGLIAQPQALEHLALRARVCAGSLVGGQRRRAGGERIRVEGLELDGIHAGRRRCLHQRPRALDRAVVVDTDLRDHVHRLAAADGASGDVEGAHGVNATGG